MREGGDALIVEGDVVLHVPVQCEVCWFSFLVLAIVSHVCLRPFVGPAFILVDAIPDVRVRKVPLSYLTRQGWGAARVQSVVPLEPSLFLCCLYLGLISCFQLR